MKIELYVNGFLQDVLERRNVGQPQLIEQMKNKWWFLLARSKWQICVCRESKMNDINFKSSEFVSTGYLDNGFIPSKMNKASKVELNEIKKDAA